MHSCKASKYFSLGWISTARCFTYFSTKLCTRENCANAAPSTSAGNDFQWDEQSEEYRCRTEAELAWLDYQMKERYHAPEITPEVLAVMQNRPTCWGKTIPAWIGRYPAQTALALKVGSVFFRQMGQFFISAYSVYKTRGNSSC